MARIAYFDCPTGIAGNMCLGALLAAGVPLGHLLTQLKKLDLAHEYDFTVTQVRHQEQAATAVTIKVNSAHSFRHLPDIEALIRQANLPGRVVEWSLAIFRELAAAEASVHGILPEQVHFHEVGAADAIVDVVGTCLGLDWLGVDHIVCSPLPVGGGTVKAAHGRLPVPAPAVLELLKRAQVPIYSNGIEKELVTPTGAAIATTLSASFGPSPAMTLNQVGLGAGSHELPIPNILRLWLGTASITSCQPSAHDHHLPNHAPQPPAPNPGYCESIIELQTQLDDLTPQAIGYLYDGLFQIGALDIFTQAIGMKKNRSGILLTVICTNASAAACQSLLFSETTTLGVRRTVQQRQTLYRRWQSVTTDYGQVQIKAGLATPDGPVLNLQPEYESCAQLARDQRVAWKQVQWAAIAAAQPLYQAHDWPDFPET
ncbi:MAG: nickel pincer cofactor biosynthesis protein LarC [Symploca sp. SIO2G7]|nr:nickel pincer cofactor biosynthesis protein LarC [Symploca sp. SIO2G7]